MKVRDRVTKECTVFWINLANWMESRRLVIHVNTDEEKRVKRQRAIVHIQSTPDFKYFKCSAWLRAPETSVFAQDVVAPDWENMRVTKRTWESAIQIWRKKLKLFQEQEW